jgi:hypothetical protein
VVVVVGVRKWPIRFEYGIIDPEWLFHFMIY